MTFDKSNLPNLKIRVNNPEESERAQRAFLAININAELLLAPKTPPFWPYFMVSTAKEIGWASDAYFVSSHAISMQYQEITLPKLESLATKHKYQSLEFVDMNKVFLGRNTCLAAIEEDPNIDAGGEGLNSFETIMEESAHPSNQTEQITGSYVEKNPVLFVYQKDGQTKALSFTEAKEHGDGLLSENWQHVATLDAKTFIGHHYNQESEAQNRYDAAIISFDDDFYDRIGDSDMEQIISSLKIAAGLTNNE